MRYTYLRVFALEVEQPPILVAAGSINSRPSREEYLTTIFSSQMTFEHYKKNFSFVPITTDDVDGGHVVSARIGVQKTMHINASPNQKLEPEDMNAWQASNFFLDTRGFQDGQKIAMQDRTEVGKPLAIINSLIMYINELHKDSGWVLELNSITEKTTFWEAAKKYKGQITKAEFNYVTPNVLGIRSALNTVLTQYRDTEKAQKVRVELENDKGDLILDSQRVVDAVEYISEGGGSTKLKVGKETVYDSEDDEVSVGLAEEEELQIEDQEKRRSFLGRLFK